MTSQKKKEKSTVELRQDREDDYQIWDQIEAKVVTKFFGKNLVHLLRLSQVLEYDNLLGF